MLKRFKFANKFLGAARRSLDTASHLEAHVGDRAPRSCNEASHARPTNAPLTWRTPSVLQWPLPV